MNKERYQHIFVILREGINFPDRVEWFTWKQMKQDVEVMIAHGMMDFLHEQMQFFYNDYLWRNIESSTAWYFIDFVAHKDN